MVANYHGRLHTADFDQTFETNARGLRGPDPGNKSPGEFRIVVLGDGFVMGAEVPLEQCLTERLTVLLYRRGCTGVTVVGVGFWGWGTYNEAGFLHLEHAVSKIGKVRASERLLLLAKPLFHQDHNSRLSTSRSHKMHDNSVHYGSRCGRAECVFSELDHGVHPTAVGPSPRQELAHGGDELRFPHAVHVVGGWRRRS